MKLIQIYECFCDETRLRIFNLLTKTPLCVSHIQQVLQLPQVNISKHLSYMKEREMVDAARFENWMLYSLTQKGSQELESNLKCLQDCCQEYPIFKEDLKRLESVLEEINKIKEKAKR